jgi:hypothetical protein
VRAAAPLTEWATLTGLITAGRKIQLRVDGRMAAEAALPGFIASDPRDPMQIGADLGSPVLDPALPKFSGWVESVRIWSGEQTP